MCVSQAYAGVGIIGGDWRPLSRTVARTTEPRLAGGVVRRAATMGPMMQRIQGAFGSSLPRSDGLATGLAPLVPVLILPRPGLRFGYTTRRMDFPLRCPQVPARSEPRFCSANRKDFKWLMVQGLRQDGVSQTIENRHKGHENEPWMMR